MNNQNLSSPKNSQESDNTDNKTDDNDVDSSGSSSPFLTKGKFILSRDEQDIHIDGQQSTEKSSNPNSVPQPIKIREPTTPPNVKKPSRSMVQSQSSNQISDMDSQSSLSNDSFNLGQFVQLALNQEPLGSLSPRQYDRLLSNLMKKRQEYIRSKQVDNAQKTTEAISYVGECRQKQLNRAFQRSAHQKFREKCTNLQSDLDQYNQETEEMIKLLKEKTSSARQSLLKEHSQQREDFCFMWSSQEKMRSYTHASSTLIVLRKQFNELLAQCRFNEAKSIQKLITEREREEKEGAQKAMQRDFNKSMQKLLDKQQEELDNFDQNAAQKLHHLESDRNKGLFKFQNRQKRLDEIQKDVNDSDLLFNLAQQQRLNEISKKPKDLSIFKMKQKKSAILSTRISLPPLNTTRTSSIHDISVTTYR